MKAILINSEKQEVTEVEYDGNWETIRKWIGGNCSIFTTVQLYENGDTAFVDDEGLFNGTITAFHHKNYPDPLMGNALILGCDIGSGNSLDPATSIEQIKEDVHRWGFVHEKYQTMQ